MMNKQLTITLLFLLYMSSAFADGALGVLPSQGLLLLFLLTAHILLSILISLIINFLIFRRAKFFKTTVIGAIFGGLFTHLMKDYFSFNSPEGYFTAVFICGLIGGLLFYFIANHKKKT